MEPISPCKVGVLGRGAALHCCVLLAVMRMKATQPVCPSSVQAGAGTRGPKEQRGSLWFCAHKQMDLWLQLIDSELKCYLARGGERPPSALLRAAASAHHEQQFKAGCGCGFFSFSVVALFFFMGAFFFFFPFKPRSSVKKTNLYGLVLAWGVCSSALRGGSCCVGAAPAGRAGPAPASPWLWMGVLQDEGLGKGMELGLWMGLEFGWGWRWGRQSHFPRTWGPQRGRGPGLRLLEASPEQGWFLVSHLRTHLRTNTALHPGDRAWGLTAAWC